MTGVAKDDRIDSRDYMALTGGQDPELVAGMVEGGGSCVQGIACTTDKVHG